MDQLIPTLLAEDRSGVLLEDDYLDPSQYLVLKIPKWKIKTVVIEVLMLFVGFFCVLTYNWIFKASIPPVLGVIVGGINGTLVAWCVTISTASRE